MSLLDLHRFEPAAVHRPLLQGHQLVAALWFPADWFDDVERARRVLAHWRVGATVWRFAQGDLLRYATAVERECETLGGWPLRRHGAALCSAPLSDAEASAIAAADVWIVQGGQVTALDFRDAQLLDPSQWLAIGGIALHDTFDCRIVLPEATTLAPPDARDLREVLNGRVAPASQDQQEFVRAMAQRKPAQASSASGTSGHPATPSSLPSLATWRTVLSVAAVVAVLSVAPWLAIGAIGYFGGRMLLSAIRSVSASASRRAAGKGRAKAGAPRPAPTIPARRKRLLQPQAWREWLARLAITLQVSQLLGRRQAAYVRKMLDLFESGQLDEALRHAIPLGGDDESLGQAFGTPGPRADLSLHRDPGNAASIHLGDNLDTYLRRLYRQSFEKLDRAGRIDEAVFVLAELLNARQEALDYLEQHERYVQAAELALAWDRPAEVIVRLHCLAGDWRRAVAVARRDDAFDTAVLQLETKWPDAAARLREEWAQALAARGDWLDAVETIWPIRARRALAVEWLVGAEAAGGHLGVRALVKRAVLLPETLVDFAPRLEELRDATASHDERAAMALALLGLKDPHPRAAQLARIIAPATLADQGAGRGQLSKKQLQRLLALADDAWLQADLPRGALPAVGTQDLALNSVPLQGVAPEAGAHVILDAVALDDQQYLVALGEAGAIIVGAHGRIVARFSVPAQRIVIAHSRQVALVMTRRDRVWRVSRLDIANRRVVDLGMAELGEVATEFNGIAWTVAGGTRLRVLDTQHSLSDVLWQVADLPGPVSDLSVTSRVEQVALQGAQGAMELWRYELPQRRLLARDEFLPGDLAKGTVVLLNPNGGVIELWRTTRAEGGESIHCRIHGRTWSVDWPHITADGMPMLARLAGPWLLVGLGDASSTHWCVIALATGRIHVNIEWPTDARPRARITAGHCMLFDSQGRLWDLDTATSAMRGVSVR